MIIVDDDFLDEQTIHDFYNSVISDNYPIWQSTGMIHGDRDVEPEHANIFKIKDWSFSKEPQFCRVLNDFDKPSFEYGDIDEKAKKIFLTFCRKHNIKPKSVMRAKINFLWPSEDNRKAPHVDATYDHKIFLYYLNDSDGPTVFYDKSWPHQENQKLNDSIHVLPKAGRGVLFDGLNFHSPLSPSLNNRLTLNVAFIPEPDV